jgi:hypothetical protein
MDARVVAAARQTFPAGTNRLTLGAVVHQGECDPEPLVSLPIAMLNRHGLIAGATATGKTKTLQLLAEQLSAGGEDHRRSRDHSGDARSDGRAARPTAAEESSLLSA